MEPPEDLAWAVTGLVPILATSTFAGLMQTSAPSCPALIVPLAEPFGLQLLHLPAGAHSPGPYPLPLDAPPLPQAGTPSPVRKRKAGTPSRRQAGRSPGTPSPSRRAIASPRRLEVGRIRASGLSWKCPVCCETVTNWSERLCPRCKGASRPVRPQESRLSPDSPLAREWTCASCDISNFGWRMACVGCGCAKL